MRLRDLNPFWRQLPVYSPVTFWSLWAGSAGVLGHDDPLRRLRELLLREYGCDDLLLVDSGTSALRLAISGALADTGSDIVALPAYCCFDVATAAVGADARVALYDVRPDTLGPDFGSLRAALDAGARAIVVAHLYGIPVDLDRCREMADEYDAVLIEDAAQGAGGSWGDRPLGSWGDLGILSFGRGKGRTGGGGGALLANAARGAVIMNRIGDRPGTGGRGLGAIAKLAVQWALGRPTLYGIPASLPFLGLGETKYKEPWEPREMATGPAAALLVNWKASEEEIRVRKRTTEFLVETGVVKGLYPVQASSDGGFLRLPVISQPHCRQRLRGCIKGGVTAGYPHGLADTVSIRDNLVAASTRSTSSVLAESLFTLPTHSKVRLDDLLSLFADAH